MNCASQYLGVYTTGKNIKNGSYFFTESLKLFIFIFKGVDVKFIIIF